MITQGGYNRRYMSYLYGKVKDKFSYLPARIAISGEEDRTVVQFETEKRYCPYVRRFTEENIADVIAIGYKYAYFERKLSLPLLSAGEKRLLFTALAAADLKEDRDLIAQKIKGLGQYCLDGVFHFRLQELQKRWEGIAEYVPTDFGKQSMEGFIGFLVEDGDGKIYLKDGVAYDESYRALGKSVLTGARSLIGEVLLCGAGRVYCFGEVDRETKDFLHKYYKEKAVFC